MGLQHVAEMRALVASGDLDIADYQARFKAKSGRDAKLTEEQWLKLFAVDEEEDPLDDDQLVVAVEKWERS